MEPLRAGILLGLANQTVVAESLPRVIEETKRLRTTAVLERVFGRLASMNTFTELVLVSEARGEIKRWPPRMAERQLI